MPKNATANADPDAVVGQQIRALRKRREGMSQQQLADRLHDLGREMSQPVVGRLEGVGGQRSITIADLFAVAVALDVAPVELLAASFDPRPVPIVGEIELEPKDAADWVRGYRPLADGNERLYFDATSDERYKADLRVRGLLNMRLILSDYEEAAVRDDVYGMDESLRALRDELDRQMRNLEPKLSVAQRRRRQRRKPL